MKVVTGNIDKAAFYATFDGELLDIQGTYPHNLFVFKIPGWLAAHETIGGWIPYNKFCNQRRHLKRQARKQSGLPERFTGDSNTGFKLGDIAMIKPVSQARVKEMLKKEG